MINKSWLQRGSQFTLVEGEFDVIQKMKPGIYNITLDLQGWHLERFQERFEFPFKIYGLQNDFIQYILKTYYNTTGNLGVLLNGTKGAGKTVCAKVLANELNLPVIIIKSWGDKNQEMIEYLGSFNFDCILFFDEFEKQFDEKDSTVLQIMDGVYNNTESRKVFLLTTNKLHVNENLLSRPSRIRYVRAFNDIEKEVVKEYLDDNLEDKSCIEDLLGFIDTLEVSTIDILKAIVQEVNIHGFEEFQKAKKWFNVSISEFEYSTWRGYIEIENVEEILKRTGIDSLSALFERDVHIKSNPPLNPSYSAEWELLTEAEKKAALSQFQKDSKCNFYSTSRRRVYSEIKFQNLKPGDFFDGEEIVFLDKKRCIVGTTDGDDYFYYYKINNPEQTPHLWGERANYDMVYGYNL